MVDRLAGGELTVGELAAPLAMSLAAASKHIKVLSEAGLVSQSKVLEGAGLVQRTVDGRRHVCRLDAAPLASASAWLNHYERFWTKRLDALQTMFEEEDS